MELFQKIFSDYTLRTIVLGSSVLGIISGVLGSFAVIRKQSLLGDTISHASLPGIALAFLLTGSKSTLTLILGALLAGWLGTLLIMLIINKTPLKSDSALGIVLSVFFGFGLVLLTYIQKNIPEASQAGLDKYLFGQAAALVEKDVILMSILGGTSLLIIIIFWKEFKLLSFDQEFGFSIGFPMRILDLVLTTSIVIAIIIGLQTVGVVLMSAMIIAPAAAARQWTNRFGIMVCISSLFGALGGITGALISSTTRHLPTGPTIIIVLSGIVFLSIILAPNRGLFWRWIHFQKSKRKIQPESVLSFLYEMGIQHKDITHGHSVGAIKAMSGGKIGIKKTLKILKLKGLVNNITLKEWSLTHNGISMAKKIIGKKV